MRGILKWQVWHHRQPALRHIGVAMAGLLLLAWAAPVPAQPALQDMGSLRAAVSSFAAGPARLDPSMVVPRCPQPAMSWARPDVVRVDCADPAWTLYVPIDRPGATGTVRPANSRPAIRRGDRVMVQASGEGFAVTLEAEAERDADGTRIALKTPSGRRLVGRIEESGRVVIPR